VQFVNLGGAWFTGNLGDAYSLSGNARQIKMVVIFLNSLELYLR
jgi:hypothetical protein